MITACLNVYCSQPAALAVAMVAAACTSTASEPTVRTTSTVASSAVVSSAGGAALASPGPAGAGDATSGGPHTSAVVTSTTPPASPGQTTRPNIVFVLTDDLSENLISHMPHVLALQKAGMSMSNYYVVDSLC